MEEVPLGWALKSGSGSDVWVWWGKKTFQESTVDEGACVASRPSFQETAVSIAWWGAWLLVRSGDRCLTG